MTTHTHTQPAYCAMNALYSLFFEPKSADTWIDKWRQKCWNHYNSTRLNLMWLDTTWHNTTHLYSCLIPHHHMYYIQTEPNFSRYQSIKFWVSLINGRRFSCWTKPFWFILLSLFCSFCISEWHNGLSTSNVPHQINTYYVSNNYIYSIDYIWHAWIGLVYINM